MGKEGVGGGQRPGKCENDLAESMTIHARLVGVCARWANEV